VLEGLSKSMDFLFDQADYVRVERQRRPAHEGIMMHGYESVKMLIRSGA
jgi:hypothetical protein